MPFDATCFKPNLVFLLLPFLPPLAELNQVRFKRSFAFVTCLSDCLTVYLSIFFFELLTYSCPFFFFYLQNCYRHFLAYLIDVHINKCVLFVWPFNSVASYSAATRFDWFLLNVDHHYHHHFYPYLRPILLLLPPLAKATTKLHERFKTPHKEPIISFAIARKSKRSRHALLSI